VLLRYTVFSSRGQNCRRRYLHVVSGVAEGDTCRQCNSVSPGAMYWMLKDWTEPVAAVIRRPTRSGQETDRKDYPSPRARLLTRLSHRNVDGPWPGIERAVMRLVGDFFNSLVAAFGYTPCPEKSATLFFAITLPNPNRSSKFLYHHTQQ